MPRPRKIPNRINSLVDEHVYKAVAMLVYRRAKESKTTPQSVLRTLLEECLQLHPTIAPLVNMLRLDAGAIAPDESTKAAVAGEMSE